MLRNSPVRAGATLGLLLVVPMVLAILSGHSELFMHVRRYLPSSLGMDFVAIRTLPEHPNQVQAGLPMLAWSPAALAGAPVTVKRRDA
ncbi:hypothetical protein [Arthrobacter globiformis]|uniref:Uncharacterized protein n=1 Tax=Arthrobacter globiformis TaxID=1665 RepID=A0A328HC02_ARTGO|nr:hypothetical protein [Arthrobacter globiformis]RAM36116.1 hypothetical protein DBZ45_18435 [Arthrobacter globiformis]